MPAGQLIIILIIIIRGRRTAVTIQITTAVIHNHRQGHIRRHQDLLHQVEEFHLGKQQWWQYQQTWQELIRTVRLRRKHDFATA